MDAFNAVFTYLRRAVPVWLRDLHVIGNEHFSEMHYPRFLSVDMFEGSLPIEFSRSIEYVDLLNRRMAPPGLWNFRMVGAILPNGGENALELTLSDTVLSRGVWCGEALLDLFSKA